MRWCSRYGRLQSQGRAYLPIDPKHPSDRIEHMLSDSGASFGLTTSAISETLPEIAQWLMIDDALTIEMCSAEEASPIRETDRVSVLRPEHPAYLIYTSGSTGKPKGVAVTHSGASRIAEYRERVVLRF